MALHWHPRCSAPPASSHETAARAIAIHYQIECHLLGDPPSGSTNTHWGLSHLPTWIIGLSPVSTNTARNSGQFIVFYSTEREGEGLKD